MQLEASKRHASGRPARPLHKRLARRRAAQARLFTGGVAALAGSAVGWLFGLTLPLHLALLGLGFAGGFFWRFIGVGRRAERWAFGWIEPQAGLSYETALELPASDTSPLGEAVRARAARAEGLGTPPLEPWALPPLVLALALAAVPHFVLPTLRAPLEPLLPQILTTANPDVAPPAEPEAGVPEPEAAAEPETGTPETAEPEPGTDTPSEENAANDDGGDSSVNTDAAAPATGTAPSESATLEQFLEGSGAAQPGEGGREASGAEAQAAAEAAAQRSAAEDEGTPGGEGNGPGQPSAEARPGGNENAPANAGAGEPSADDALESTNRDLRGARPSGAEDEATGQEGSEAGGEGEGTPPDAQAVPPQGAQQGAGEPGQGDGPSQPGEASEGRSQTGQGSEQGSSDEAGRGSGGEAGGGGERLPGGTLERLTGERTEGDPNLRAETLQQGDVPDTLPRTGGPESYRRAAEEVIREGRIPLEYQQLVRDYFR